MFFKYFLFLHQGEIINDKYLFISESVSEGHLTARISLSDTIVDLMIGKDLLMLE